MIFLFFLWFSKVLGSKVRRRTSTSGTDNTGQKHWRPIDRSILTLLVYVTTTTSHVVSCPVWLVSNVVLSIEEEKEKTLLTDRETRELLGILHMSIWSQ